MSNCKESKESVLCVGESVTNVNEDNSLDGILYILLWEEVSSSKEVFMSIYDCKQSNLFKISSKL